MASKFVYKGRPDPGISKAGLAGGAAVGAGGALTGASTGAAAGAALGSIVPGLGTAIGGTLGGILGGIAGGVGGAATGYKVGEAGSNAISNATKDKGNPTDAIQRRLAASAPSDEADQNISALRESMIALGGVSPEERKQYGPTIQMGYQKAVLDKYGVG